MERHIAVARGESMCRVEALDEVSGSARARVSFPSFLGPQTARQASTHRAAGKNVQRHLAVVAGSPNIVSSSKTKRTDSPAQELQIYRLESLNGAVVEEILTRGPFGVTVPWLDGENGDTKFAHRSRACSCREGKSNR